MSLRVTYSVLRPQELPRRHRPGVRRRGEGTAAGTQTDLQHRGTARRPAGPGGFADQKAAGVRLQPDGGHAVQAEHVEDRGAQREAKREQQRNIGFKRQKRFQTGVSSYCVDTIIGLGFYRILRFFFFTISKT